MGHCYETIAAEDSRSKRQQILDAAYQVFSCKGFHRATVDEIIALADTGKGTVYNYFTNKEQLFYTLIRERSAPFEAALENVVKSSYQPVEKITEMIRLFLRFYVANGDLWRVMMHEMRGYGSASLSQISEEQRGKYQETFRHTIGMLEEVLKEGVAKGVIRDCDATKAAYGLFSVIVAMVFQKFVGDDIDKTADAITDTLLYGIAKR